MLSPLVKRLDNEWAGRVLVGQVNIYENMPLTLRYGVMSAPVLVLVKNGEVVKRTQGFLPYEKLLATFSPYLN